MPSSTTAELAPQDIPQAQWDTLAVRLTSFHSSVIATDELPTFEDLFGRKPEALEERLAQMERVETITLGAGLFQRRRIGDRVDWFLTSPIDLGAPVQQGSLGHPIEVINQVVTIAQGWINSRKDLVRLAVGGIFAIPTPDRDSAYNLLNNKLKFVKLDPKAMAEFSLQVNSPTAVQVGSMAYEINRLSKWHARKKLLSATFSTTTTTTESKISETHDIACEVDVNTVVVPNRTIQPEEIPEVMGYLTKFCVELLEFYSHA